MGTPGFDAEKLIRNYHQLRIMTGSSPVINLRILVVLKRLDHEPLDEEGDDIGGATSPAPGEGLARDHAGDRGLCRTNELRW